MVTAFIPEFPLFRKGKNFHYNTVSNNKNLKIPNCQQLELLHKLWHYHGKIYNEAYLSLIKKAAYI